MVFDSKEQNEPAINPYLIKLDNLSIKSSPELGRSDNNHFTVTPTIQKVGDELVNISAQRGQPAFIDESAGEEMSLRFPFTVLDNIYQTTNRGNYYQSRMNDNNWQVFQSASMNAVMTSVP